MTNKRKERWKCRRPAFNVFALTLTNFSDQISTNVVFTGSVRVLDILIHSCVEECFFRSVVSLFSAIFSDVRPNVKGELTAIQKTNCDRYFHYFLNSVLLGKAAVLHLV